MDLRTHARECKYVRMHLYTCVYVFMWHVRVFVGVRVHMLAMQCMSVMLYETCVVYVSIGVPEAQTVKNPPANAGDPGMVPASGRPPGGGDGNPLQCSCLENPTE